MLGYIWRCAAAVIDATPTRPLSSDGLVGLALQLSLGRCHHRRARAVARTVFWAVQPGTLCHYPLTGVFEWTHKISLSTACDLWVGEKPFRGSDYR